MKKYNSFLEETIRKKYEKYEKALLLYEALTNTT